MSEPIFRARAGAFEPTGHARGPWDPDAQHGGAPAALLARTLEAVEPGSPMFVARVTYEFLGPVPLAPLVADAWLQRPGRRFQLLEGELRCEGRTVVRARAVRLRRAAVDLPAQALAPAAPPAAGPQESRPEPFPDSGEPEGFHRTAMEIRFAEGSYAERGPSRAWFRLARPLVGEEEPSPLQRAVAAADFGNGVSRVLDFSAHLFVNTDLSVHLHREPRGPWILLDARTVADPGGAGLASSRLSDEDGEIGLATQTLFVEER